MHLLLCSGDSETDLRAELAEAFPDAAPHVVGQSLLETHFDITPGQKLPQLAFSRQLFPNARQVKADSIRAWATEILNAVVGVIPDDQPWRLHIEPHYGLRLTHRIGARAWHTLTVRKQQAGPRRPPPASAGEPPGPSRPAPSHAPAPLETAGSHRCALIRQAVVDLLQKKRRLLLRQLEPVAADKSSSWTAPFTPRHSFAQVLLTTPDFGFISLAPAPVPSDQEHLISPFPKGLIPIRVDKTAPSRAFAKLLEAELRMSRAIQRGETCVDLGASPGSWTYVAAHRGASVIAVDHSPLRDDLMSHRRVQFRRISAFEFQPQRPVDWLLCDVIAAPEQTAALLLRWTARRSCRRFVVTIKMKQPSGRAVLAQLKHNLPTLAPRFFLKQLCANKKEICVFGSTE